MFLPKVNPKKTAANPAILLAKIFRKASLYSPVLSKAIELSAKEEKVVKPPNIPANRNTRTFTEKLQVSAKAQQKPIRNDPDTLTLNIPKGKEWSVKRCTHEDTRNLNNVPNAPPVIKQIT